MRTTINIDQTLLAEAMKAAGLASKKATVEHALQMLVRHQQAKSALDGLAGIGRDGDLDNMRSDFSRA